MAVTYNTPVTNQRLTVVVNGIDGGAGNGVLLVGTTGMGSILATLILAKPCGTVASRVLTFVVPRTDVSADASGTAAEARIEDSGGTVVVSGLTVGLAANSPDIIISNTTITIGDIVSLVSATITG